MPTGQTAADKWHAADHAGRRELLAEYGTYVRLYPEIARERVIVTSANPFTDRLGTVA
jgi:hypothetical protein